jgi:hypothetical protein
MNNTAWVQDAAAFGISNLVVVRSEARDHVSMDDLAGRGSTHRSLDLYLLRGVA